MMVKLLWIIGLAFLFSCTHPIEIVGEGDVLSASGDMIHVTDLFTTFARLGGAVDNIPTDRVVDGLDQSAVFLNGEGNGRRDYVYFSIAVTGYGRWLSRSTNWRVRLPALQVLQATVGDWPISSDFLTSPKQAKM